VSNTELMSKTGRASGLDTQGTTPRNQAPQRQRMGCASTDEKEDQIPLDAADFVRDVEKLAYSEFAKIGSRQDALQTIFPSLLDIFYHPIFDFFQKNRVFQQPRLITAVNFRFARHPLRKSLKLANENAVAGNDFASRPKSIFSRANRRRITPSIVPVF